MPRDLLQGARRGQSSLLQPPAYPLELVQALLKGADPFGKGAHLLRDQLCILQPAEMIELGSEAVKLARSRRREQSGR